MAILKIRTYLEHRVHDHPRGRSVVVEDRLLSFSFEQQFSFRAPCTSQSYVVRTAPFFASKRIGFCMNDGYHFGCYGEVIRKFAIKRKDPVAFPIGENR